MRGFLNKVVHENLRLTDEELSTMKSEIQSTLDLDLAEPPAGDVATAEVLARE